jgi:hypothetical protein
MKPRKLRSRIAAASSLGVAVMAVALLGAVGTASALTVPPFPAAYSGSTVITPGQTQQFGTYPNWLPQNESVSNVDHSEGSDTTLFMMQSISNLYSQAGLNPFSCTLIKTQTGSCETPAQAGGNPDATQADLFDNFASTEELQGTNFVGSGNGIAELCSSGPNPPTGTTVDYARSSKPGAGTTCGSGVTAQTGYAKDSVIPVDFPTVDPQAYMSTGDQAPGYAGLPFISYCQTSTAPGCSSVGQTLNTNFPSGGIGPVAAGWLPGDTFTCGQTSSCSGTPFTNLSNTVDPSSGGTGATSVAYRLFCQHGSSSTPYQSQIMDWGNLTNLSAANNGGTAQQIGDGAPIGVPIRVIGVNTGSGTTSTFYSFAQSGISGGANCTGSVPLGSSAGVDANAASGQNPQASQGVAGNLEISLENDANQVGDFANADWANQPSTPTNGDAADQAIDIATSLYFEGLGVYSTNTNAQTTSIEVPGTSTSGLVPSGQPSSFVASQMKANNVKASLTNELQNGNAMARTLFNIYRTDSIKASTAGFLNFICDDNSSFQKGIDRVNGGNFDTDLTNIIGGQYGFQRLTDSTGELQTSKQVPADGITNLNGTCAANLAIASTGGAGSSTITLSAAAPPTVQAGWPVSIPAGYGVAIPSGDTVQSVSSTTITLTNPLVAGTGSGTPSTLYFPGQAPLLSVTAPNT